MKPLKEPRRDLLEDIFVPEEGSSGPSQEEIVALIQAARGRQQRRRAVALGASAVAAIAIAGLAFVPDAPAPSAPPAIAVAPQVPEPAAMASIIPPAVEHVDDQGMIARLGDQPAALVRWPDGRQSLLLLVTRSSGK
jgi:hypothetical protein